jgi:hypothetical protein
MNVTFVQKIVNKPAIRLLIQPVALFISGPKRILPRLPAGKIQFDIRPPPSRISA